MKPRKAKPRRLPLWRRLTAPIRVLPDFAILGAQRSGTTTLYNNIIRHPAIFPASVKEVHFFDLFYQMGRNWYRAHFPTRMAMWRRSGAITGEGSPYYLFHPHAPRRMHETIPNARLIIILRNPIGRAQSHYEHTFRRKLENLPFQDAIAEEPGRLAGETAKILADKSYYSFNHQEYSYLARGLYADQLQAWEKYFPRDQMLVLINEELDADPDATYARIFEFLGVPPFSLGGFVRSNVAKYDKMSPELRERLAEYFRPHNQRLYEWLGRDLPWD